MSDDSTTGAEGLEGIPEQMRDNVRELLRKAAPFGVEAPIKMVLATVAACAADRDKAERENAALRQTVERLKGERDRLKSYWFSDAHPEETEFGNEYVWRTRTALQGADKPGDGHG